MIIPRVIPCLLIRGQGLVKTIKFDHARYIGDVINTVRIFNEKEADELLLLDITATKSKTKPQLSLIKDIASECFMPLAYGGGITSIDEIASIFEAGVEKISLNSTIFENPELISEASKIFGSQSIITAIDIKQGFLGKYSVYSHCGKVNQQLNPVEYAKRLQDLGAGEILINSIDRDGTRDGYDLSIIQKISSAVDVPVVACGGAGSLEDIKLVFDAGASAAAAGSFFVFHGKHQAVLITYPTSDEIGSLS